METILMWSGMYMCLWVISHWRRHKNVGWHVIVVDIGFTRATGTHLGQARLNGLDWTGLANWLADWSTGVIATGGVWAIALSSTKGQLESSVWSLPNLFPWTCPQLISLSLSLFFLRPGHKPSPFETKNLMSATTENGKTKCETLISYWWGLFCKHFLLPTVRRRGWTVHCIRYSFIRLICLEMRARLTDVGAEFVCCQFRFVNVAFFYAIVFLVRVWVPYLPIPSSLPDKPTVPRTATVTNTLDSRWLVNAIDIEILVNTFKQPYEYPRVPLPSFPLPTLFLFLHNLSFVVFIVITAFGAVLVDFRFPIKNVTNNYTIISTSSCLRNGYIETDITVLCTANRKFCQLFQPS